jgi:hypothetical protein
VISEAAETFDRWHPANVSPLVAYLARADCPMKGKVFYAAGGDVTLVTPWRLADGVHRDSRWTSDDLEMALRDIASIDTDPVMPE